jgi:DnaJ family protein A protein 2
MARPIADFGIGSLKVISGQGMPSFRHHEPGDLYIRINVNFPEHIDPAVIPLLEQALPARSKMQQFNTKKVHVDEVTLEEPNDRQRRSAAANGDEMDEDDDDGRPGVQCAQRE